MSITLTATCDIAGTRQIPSGQPGLHFRCSSGA